MPAGKLNRYLDAEHAEQVVAVALAAAAILTAWSGFQATKWSGVQANSYASAGAARTESVRFDQISGRQTQIDVATFLAWTEAVAVELEAGLISLEDIGPGYEPAPGLRSTFLANRLMEEFRPSFETWLDADPLRSPSAPPTPFDGELYRLAAQDESTRLQGEAEQLAQQSRDANQTADNYLLTTVLFGGVPFFAGISKSFRSEGPRWVVVGLALIVLIAAGVVILRFPIQL